MTIAEQVAYLKNAARAIEQSDPDLSTVGDQLDSYRFREAADTMEKMFEALKLARADLESTIKNLNEEINQ